MGDLLPDGWNKTYFAWPGLGANPADPSVNSYDDLVTLVEARIVDAPVDLLAQSMGGAIAMTLALRHPDKIRRLVLAVTAGGLDVSALGAADWRADYRQEFPQAADWIMEQRPDVTGRIGEIRQPTLLIWGDADPISPVAVGQHLLARLPEAALKVVRHGQHDLVKTYPAQIAEDIRAHLDV